MQRELHLEVIWVYHWISVNNNDDDDDDDDDDDNNNKNNDDSNLFNVEYKQIATD